MSADKALDELKAKLRRQLGNPTLAQYSEDQAKDAVVSAVSEYSKHSPIKVLDFVAIEKDNALYDLSEKPRILRVREVFYNVSSQFMPEDFWPDSAVWGRLEGISLFDNPFDLASVYATHRTV